MCDDSYGIEGGLVGSVVGGVVVVRGLRIEGFVGRWVGGIRMR